MAFFGAPLSSERLASTWEKSCVFNLLGQIKVLTSGLQDTPELERNVGGLSEKQQF